MERRNERVTVRYSRGEIVIPWDSRDALLDRISHLASCAGIVRAFTAVGTSRPVPLDVDDEGRLVDVLNQWSYDVGGFTNLPERLFDLRCALLDDLHDDGVGE